MPRAPFGVGKVLILFVKQCAPRNLDRRELTTKSELNVSCVNVEEKMFCAYSSSKSCKKTVLKQNVLSNLRL